MMIMKKTFQYFTWAALTFSLAACTQEDTLQEFNAPNAVRIHATIGSLQSRVAYGTDGSTDFTSGDAIKVVNTKRTSKNAATYTTADGKNWTTTDAFVWNSGTEANNQFNAWYPATASFESFDLPTEQNTEALLAAADWMTATTDAMAKPEDCKLNLSFQHKLAKVTVNISSEFGSEYGTTAPTLTDVKICTSDGVKNITPLAGTGSYTAIVTPGTYTSSSPFMTLKANDVALTVKASETLVAGSHYTFTLKVGKDAATIGEVTVAPWGTGTPLQGGVAEDITPIIDGTLGGKTEATEEDITALVEQLKAYVDNGNYPIIVTGNEPAMINMGSYTNTAIGEAIYRLPGSSMHDENNPYNGKIDLILQDVTEIVDFEFYLAYALNSITLPKVTKIRDGAFYDATHLRTITFGSVITDVIETNRVAFHFVGYNVGGCDLILNCGQMQTEGYYKPNLETNEWGYSSIQEEVYKWKSITLIHTGECDECKAAK